MISGCRRLKPLGLRSRQQPVEFLPHDGLVMPDKEILPTWADWVAGRDPVLDWIIEQ